MDSKLPPTVPPPRRRSSGAWKLVTIPCFLYLFWLVFVPDSFDRVSLRIGNRPTKYRGEHLWWTPCGLSGDREVECSSVDVPLDQFDAAASGDKTFNIPIFRLRGKKATKNVLMNPGGPGASGSLLIYGEGEKLREVVGEEFHLVSFDARGVNSSRPLASCYRDEPTRRLHAKKKAVDVIRDSSVLHAWATNVDRACKDELGEWAQHINTLQTAADMNSILDALGQKDMIYWGFSYGTILGQVYAATFPERAKRIILDGVADVQEWFESHIDGKLQYSDTNRVLAGFFDECIKAGKACQLHGYADNAEDLQEEVTRAIDKLRDNAAAVYVNSTIYGELTDYNMWHEGVFRELYVPANWPRLANALRGVLDGNFTDAFLTYGQGDIMSSVGEAYRIVTLNDGATGPDSWPQGRLEILRLLLPWLDEFFFGQSWVPVLFIKQQWSQPKPHAFKVPKNTIKTAHPVLLLSTTYDPVCPLIAAKKTQARMDGSRLVEVQGYGHCSLAMPSKCAAKYVRDYLGAGDLPPSDVQCEIDASYFPASSG